MSDQERIAELEDTVWHLRKENRFAEAEGYSQSLKRIKELEAIIERQRAIIIDDWDVRCLPSCDSYSHDPLCPWTNPKAAHRKTVIDEVLALNSLKEWDDMIPPRVVVDKIRRDIERLLELT